MRARIQGTLAKGTLGATESGLEIKGCWTKKNL